MICFYFRKKRFRTIPCSLNCFQWNVLNLRLANCCIFWLHVSWTMFCALSRPLDQQTYLKSNNRMFNSIFCSVCIRLCSFYAYLRRVLTLPRQAQHENRLQQHTSLTCLHQKPRIKDTKQRSSRTLELCSTFLTFWFVQPLEECPNLGNSDCRPEIILKNVDLSIWHSSL